MLFAKLAELRSDERMNLIKRSSVDYESVVPKVAAILRDVKARGDTALREYTEMFDGVKLGEIRVSAKEFKEARRSIDKKLLAAMEEARENILWFHLRQLPKEWSFKRKGVRAGLLSRPLESVGCYVPGGKAAYPSTVLMTVTPAKVAGVKRIVCVTPPNKEGKANPFVLAACELAGATEVYKVGGAQAIAALAYGTGSVPKVDKIVGPGNVYVTAAKELVSREVAVDMIAGPSEVLIIADGGADPEFIAYDMLAQAEHDPNAVCVLVTTSKKVADDVTTLLKLGLLEKFKTKDIAWKSLKENGAVLIAKDIGDAMEFANEFAPEHLELMVKGAEKLLAQVKSAGSVFLGEYTPVAIGDYAVGTNHVLPTMGYARTNSALSVKDFVKQIQYQAASSMGLKSLATAATTLAEAEGLRFHAESIRKRLKR